MCATATAKTTQKKNFEIAKTLQKLFPKINLRLRETQKKKNTKYQNAKRLGNSLKNLCF